MTTKPVTVYVRRDAAESRALLRFLEDRGVPFETRDALDPQVRQQMFHRYGVLTLPIVVIGKQAFFGFTANQAAIAAALNDSRS
ncbi:MAG: glutaredoxin family protein [Dehalococcoidia bacterium]|nr:glutaredoxin family protein [Dehalococcoidia bacterium]